MDFRRSLLGRPLEPEELMHVLVVLFLAELAAQVEPQLVDHLDAVVPQPVIPAVGTNLAIDAVVDVVGQRRARELAGPVPGQASGPLALEARAGALVFLRPGRFR